jgi:hypothetical protein
VELLLDNENAHSLKSSHFITSMSSTLLGLGLYLLMFVFMFFETGSHYVAQAGLELAILLPVL